MGHTVPVWDSQAEFGDTNMLVETMAQGQERCVLLRGHGATCAAASLQAVAFLSIYMKENAEPQPRMLPLGEPSYLSPGEIDQAAEMRRSPTPARRTWEYRVARAGLGGVF